ncbi:hypothetical protein VMF7928_03418 [Vibrio marisflavi CECT 7928]|uniref:Uncharacterized protein n=1 Tax=Vibrio marisflavi CECT 7928 TaxID=634439 RepID=A0ABN8E7V6_9VIBR|nr:hypothetical protein VMF7928_03418 [Vibrio marisflavi CECT 7928]
MQVSLIRVQLTPANDAPSNRSLNFELQFQKYIYH